MKRNYFNTLFLFIILFAVILFSDKGMHVMDHLLDLDSKQIVVAIDAGHGGFDPGKVGVNHTLEKDINLSIAYKLKNLLEEKDIKVIMTRKDANGLYKKTSHNKKSDDMKKRVSIINSSDAIFAISIHQNSFEQESVRGAQVFYYQNSLNGKILAETIQESMKNYLNDANHRIAKSNNSYYMLRKTTCPLVIVECGFLSNWKEADLLCDASYQEKVAEGIFLGILQYINMDSNDQPDTPVYNN